MNTKEEYKKIERMASNAEYTSTYEYINKLVVYHELINVESDFNYTDDETQEIIDIIYTYFMKNDYNSILDVTNMVTREMYEHKVPVDYETITSYCEEF